MTRETKVGLLVGCGIILLIGIVVSDHLSVASNPASTAAESFSSALPRSIHGDALNATRQPTQAPLPPRTAPLPLPRELSFDVNPVPAQRVEPSVPDNRPQPTPLTTNNTSPGLPTLRAEPTQVLISELYAQVNPEAPLPTSPASPASPSTTGSPSPAAASSAAEVLRHEVKKGESLYQIANRYYGDGEYWRQLVEANPGKVGGDGQVRVGVTLVIPNKAGQVQAPRTPASSVAASAVQTGSSSRQTTTSAKTYTVREGDTLSRIARAALGDEKQWVRLFEANHKLLGGDPDALQVGQKLALP